MDIEIASIGPFVTPVRLHLRSGITRICGGNGAGKTLLANAIHRQLLEVRQGDQLAGLPRWLTFMAPEDAGFELPYGGRPWQSLQEHLTGNTWSTLDTAALERETSTGLHELLDQKILSGSKFSGSVRASREISVVVAGNGVVNVCSNSLGDLNWAFQAAGERLILCLAFNRAIRRAIGRAHDTPAVVDGLFNFLDVDLRAGIYPFLKSLSSRVVVFESPSSLDLSPHYLIVARHASPQGERPSRVVRVGRQEICLDEYCANRDESIVVELD